MDYDETQESSDRMNLQTMQNRSKGNKYMDYALQTDRLCKYYRQYHALNGLTMNVPRGSIYGFVGRNGAGKTTLIRLICGLQKPTSGTFTLSGVHSTQKDILNIRRRMGAVVETPSIYLGMSAEDNLKQQYRILGLSSYEGLRAHLGLVGLSDTGRKKAKDFSLGMRQRLGIAIALAGSPDFLILDEPVNGLDPQGIIEIRELIQKLNRERGITVLISSHILDELHRLATWYGFIDRGKIVKEMSAEELDAVCRQYIHITVSNMTALKKVLDARGLGYSVLSEKEADIYDAIGISELTHALDAEDCAILSVSQQSESLENYFVSLVGGESHA